MASGALPPGFPPVEIDGEDYWDGGLVSNTPLQYVLDDAGRASDWSSSRSTCSAPAARCRARLAEIGSGEKDIRYSSRTRINTDASPRAQTIRRAIRRPASPSCRRALRNDPDVAGCSPASAATPSRSTIVHLIYRRAGLRDPVEGLRVLARPRCDEHWDAGLRDIRTRSTIRTGSRAAPPRAGVTMFDLTAISTPIPRSDRMTIDEVRPAPLPCRSLPAHSVADLTIWPRHNRYDRPKRQGARLMQLKDKVAFVTGAASGIGKEIAMRLSPGRRRRSRSPT